ncbi:Peptidase family M23 [Thermoanaerobacter uzonensis DSM 18761]|uniref:Peptidase family M23 n=1 Tax=Thermoanaerobacter uzonensis DSM 18761 TaxID=1123369 RepID=A0A1M4YZT3_9THEO|nr:M23 family metallopeptidase [Thermoanaerobacter uzonensis]SHF11319.1 Peptidase family M23 [Thermoanaerobacter uzonensis DSM 18761]
MKKKKKKYLNIMIIPDSNQQIKSFKISIPLIKTVAIVAFSIIMAATASLVYFGKTTTYLYTMIAEKDKKIEQLTSVKEEQDKKIATLDKNAQLVSERIKGLNELEEKVRRMVGLSTPATSRGSVSRNGRSDANISYDNETTAELISQIDQKTQSLQDLISKVAARLDYLNSIPSAYPVYGTITSPFGMRKSPFGYGSEFHPGIDISVPVGTPVKAAGKGVVTYAGWLTGYGNAVIIDHGYGIESVYGHNSEILVKVGQSVKRGDIIAKSGNTGRSTGPHVHFEVRVNGNPIDPMKYLAKGN